jgi:hypothetical protein
MSIRPSVELIAFLAPLWRRIEGGKKDEETKRSCASSMNPPPKGEKGVCRLKFSHTSAGDRDVEQLRLVAGQRFTHALAQFFRLRDAPRLHAQRAR